MSRKGIKNKRHGIYKPELKVDNKPLCEHGFSKILIDSKIFWIDKKVIEEANRLPMHEAKALVNRFKIQPEIRKT